MSPLSPLGSALSPLGIPHGHGLGGPGSLGSPTGLGGMNGLGISGLGAAAGGLGGIGVGQTSGWFIPGANNGMCMLPPSFV